MVLQFIHKYFFWILLLVVFLSVDQRRIPDSGRKRGATVFICLLMMIWDMPNIFFIAKGLNPNWAWATLAACILLAFLWFRRRGWPYRLHCAKCGRKLDWVHVIGHDDNLCQSCWDEAHPEEVRKREAEKTGKKPFVCPDTVDAMDWDDWDVTDRCVITYLMDGGNLLMIEKKTGLGSGYLNAPGGHIEDAETADEAAVREFKEETGLDIDPSSLSLRGELFFQFKQGIAEHAYVYTASRWSGAMIGECEETRPFWYDMSQGLPYDRMWEDDRLWVPVMMSGRKFKAYFIFDDRKMLDHKVVAFDDKSEDAE